MQRNYEFQQDLIFLRKYRHSSSATQIKSNIIRQFEKVFGVRIHSSPQNPLSFMELLCLALFLVGKRQKQVADLLHLSIQTVNSYEQSIRKKLVVKNRQAACHEALIKRYLALSPSLTSDE